MFSKEDALLSTGEDVDILFWNTYSVLCFIPYVLIMPWKGYAQESWIKKHIFSRKSLRGKVQTQRILELMQN